MTSTTTIQPPLALPDIRCVDKPHTLIEQELVNARL
jgi:hypothetical protein